MKRVTYNVAKYLETLGYPQNRKEYGYTTEKCWDRFNVYSEGTLTDNASRLVKKVTAPYWFDVYLWICEKVPFEIFYTKSGEYYCLYNSAIQCPLGETPEKALSNAIEYLIENNILKYLIEYDHK